MNNKAKVGLENLKKLHGEHTGEDIVNAFKDISPNLLKWTLELGFAEIIPDKRLDIKTRELTIIACLIPQGTLPQIKAHIEAAITVGASKDEIIALIEQSAIYAGFPAAVNAMIIAKEVFTNE
jgi:4-carboxymuconolactone decarboxylase